jgi:hypothetical protein
VNVLAFADSGLGCRLPRRLPFWPDRGQVEIISQCRMQYCRYDHARIAGPYDLIGRFGAPKNIFWKAIDKPSAGYERRIVSVRTIAPGLLNALPSGSLGGRLLRLLPQFCAKMPKNAVWMIALPLLPRGHPGADGLDRGLVLRALQRGVPFPIADFVEAGFLQQRLHLALIAWAEGPILHARTPEGFGFDGDQGRRDRAPVGPGGALAILKSRPRQPGLGKDLIAHSADNAA